MLLTGISGTTAGVAALWAKGSAHCVNVQATAGVGATYMQAPNDGVPVAEWHFDEGSGNSLNDCSENGNDVAIYGATWITGKFGSALNFGGNDDVYKYRGIKL